MAEHTLGSVGRRALGESLQAVKLDKPLSVLIAFGVPGLVGLTTWWRTGEAAMTGFFALGAVAALFAAIFLGKMISVPLAVAAESDARRNAAEDALGARVAVLEALQAEQRDPDAIYQYGMIVAKVMHPTLVRQQGIIHFAALVDA